MTSPVFTPGTKVRIIKSAMEGRTGTVRPLPERLYGFDVLVRVDRPRGVTKDFFFYTDELEPLS